MNSYKLEAFRKELNIPFMVKECSVLDFGFLCKKAVKLGAVRIVIEEMK